MLADAVADAWGLPAYRRVRWARKTEGTAGREPVRIVKPLSYMNRSGVVLRTLLSAGLDPATDLLILVDDVDLPVGVFRLRARGSAGGHKGLKSIAGALQSNEYPRLRIGAGPVSAGVGRTDFVLEPFPAEQRDTIRRLMPEMIEAVECWLHEGITTAMNRFNRRGNRD